MAEDAKALIELATRRFIEEVPALEPIKLVVGVELRGSGDVQQFRLEMPGCKVTKGPAADARVRVDMRREFFNVMAREGKVRRLDRGVHLRPGQGLRARADPAADRQRRRAPAGARAHAQGAQARLAVARVSGRR